MKKLAVAACLLLVGCGVELDGLVEGKAYRPAYDTPESRPIYTTVCYPRTSTTFVNGRSTTTTTQDCRQVYMGEDHYIQHNPECWEITVKQDEDGKLRTKCVPKSVYDSLDNGEHYSEKGDKK